MHLDAFDLCGDGASVGVREPPVGEDRRDPADSIVSTSSSRAEGLVAAMVVGEGITVPMISKPYRSAK